MGPSTPQKKWPAGAHLSPRSWSKRRPPGALQAPGKILGVPRHPPPEDPGGRATRSNADTATGAVAAAGLPVLETLRNLVLRKIDRVGKLSFLAVNGVREVSVLHSFYCVGGSTCDFMAGGLYTIRGKIPAAGLPVVVCLELILFVSNFPFVGTLRLELAGHLGGLESSLACDFEDTAHQVADGEEDEGVRLIQLRGIAFVPRAPAAVALEEGLHPAVTDVLCRMFEALSRQDKAFDGALDSMQASFTDQSDSTYVGRVRTRWEPTEVESPRRIFSSQRATHAPSRVLPRSVPPRTSRRRRKRRRRDPPPRGGGADQRGVRELDHRL